MTKKKLWFRALYIRYDDGDNLFYRRLNGKPKKIRWIIKMIVFATTASSVPVYVRCGTRTAQTLRCAVRDGKTRTARCACRYELAGPGRSGGPRRGTAVGISGGGSTRGGRGRSAPIAAWAPPRATRPLFPHSAARHRDSHLLQHANAAHTRAPVLTVSTLSASGT